MKGLLRGIGFTCTLVFAAIVSRGTVEGAVSTTDVTFFDALSALAAVTPECEAECDNWGCGTNSHVAHEGAFDALDGGLHSYCATGDCAYYGGTKHPVCEGYLLSSTPLMVEALARLERAVDSEDADQLGRLVEAAPEVFTFNRERFVIQVVGCDSGVLGQYPVPAAFADRLT